MTKLLQSEIWKLKRYSVIWIGIATMLSVVLLTCFMEIGTPGIPTFSSFADNVIWNNFSLIFPATIALIAGYIIERERTDDTLKNLAAIPVSFRRLLIGKIIVCGIIAILLAMVEFIFTTIISFMGGYDGLALSNMIKILFQMIGMNCFVFVSVLPIIVFTGQRAGAFMSGVAFAFFYGFIGTFATGHGLASIYPITIGLGFINYLNGNDTGTYNIFLCSIVLLILITVTAISLFLAHDRDKAQNPKGGGRWTGLRCRPDKSPEKRSKPE